jgi:hypothetical protein
MTISDRFASARRRATALHGQGDAVRDRVAVMPGAALCVAGFVDLGYISGNVATLVDGVGKILAFGDAHARRIQ